MTATSKVTAPARLLTAALVVGALVTLTACSGKSDAKATASATPSATQSGLAGDGGGGLAGGDGETSTAPRSTILTTPTPTLSSVAGAKEVDGTCPYISNKDFADGEGDRVGRVTILQTKPVGCRFYFQYNVNTIIGEIDVSVFKTATQAYNAMVGSAKNHPEVQSDATIGDGAVAFKSPLQGNSAWLCVFAKGTSVVTVRTQQPYPALNALNLAKTIAPKFK